MSTKTQPRMTIKCGNCKSTLSCTCQKRQALDGTNCCKACVTDFNNKLKVKGFKAITPIKTPGGINSPTNVQATYAGPGKMLN